MTVGAITPYGTSGVNTTNYTPVKKPSQPPTAIQSIAPKAYEVTLTTEAKVKALELQGYSVSMISAKLGLDTKTISQYLGIAATTNSSTVKTTYTPPKSTYTAPKPINTTSQPLPAYTAPKSAYAEPKASYTEPPSLTQGRTQLATALAQLPTIQYAASQLITSAQHSAINLIKNAGPQ